MTGGPDWLIGGATGPLATGLITDFGMENGILGYLSTLQMFNDMLSAKIHANSHCPSKSDTSSQPLLQMAAPNGGIGPKHGGTIHNDMLDDYINSLPSGAQNIRKNQQQVDINGNPVGENRPDIQYDMNGQHYNVEIDANYQNSIDHFMKINGNDPISSIELIF